MLSQIDCGHWSKYALGGLTVGVGLGFLDSRLHSDVTSASPLTTTARILIVSLALFQTYLVIFNPVKIGNLKIDLGLRLFSIGPFSVSSDKLSLVPMIEKVCHCIYAFFCSIAGYVRGILRTPA